MRRSLSLGLVTLFWLVCTGCAVNSRQDEAAQIVQNYVAKVEPLTTQANRVYWDASTTGKPEKFAQLEQLQVQARRICSDPNDFNRIKELRDSKKVRDPRLARQLDKLYFGYLQNQIDPALLEQIVKLDTKVQETYNNYRGTV
ncbi:MAG: hypothetical protein ACM3VT_04345, partial [Solirubrobacterales bacterium]